MSNIAWSWAWPGLECTLSVSLGVAEVFDQYRQTAWKTERGGQLFVDLADP
ncbi:hypothetical protein [Pseudomonas fluorescens]|nr:hypothetical protein [Pseudomonas fluorescens]